MNTVDIKVLRLHDGVRLPTYATPGSMCFDLHLFAPAAGAVHVPPGKCRMLHTGIAFGLPAGWGLNAYSRSGHGRIGVNLANGVGKIDQDYTGELMVCLANHSDEVVTFAHGDRIAQAEPVPIWRANFTEVGGLAATVRGTGGFGSTGR